MDKIRSAETCSLEQIHEEIRRRAQAIADYALSHTGIVPPKVAEILAAGEYDMRVVQLHRLYTREQLDEWVQEEIEAIEAAWRLLIGQD